MFPMRNGDSPSYAEIALAKIREQNKIDLYPQEEDDDPPILKSLREHYEQLETNDRFKAENEIRLDFNHILSEEVLTEAINTIIIEPVLENNFPTSRDVVLAKNLIYDFVHENGVPELIHNFKYRNVYLAEVALVAEQVYNDMEKHKGLTREDIDDIENDSIKDKILKKEAKLPKNISQLISKRVEDSVNDFLSDKRDMDFKLRQIYNKAQEKVDKYNQEKEAMLTGTQSAVDTLDGSDPELGVDSMYNSKMDAQQGQEVLNQGPNTGLGVQEQYLAEAKDMEYQLLNAPYSVFDAMMRIVVESTYKNNILRESYMDLNNEFDYQKLLNDVRTMYTVLECINSLNMIDIDSKYLTHMLQQMQETSNDSSTDNVKIDPKVEKLGDIDFGDDKKGNNNSSTPKSSNEKF